MERNLKMREVVAKTGIDQALISKFEHGSRIPTDEQVVALSRCFEVEYSELKKHQLAEMVYAVLADEPFALEALVLAEPRIEYLTSMLPTETIEVSSAVQLTLDKLDILKAELGSLRQEQGVHVSKVDEHFALRYTYESNKIEGNTLTLSETMMVIKEGITISGKSVNEHLEAINHSEAIELMYDFVGRKVAFTEYLMLQFHGLILRGIDRSNAGRYRNVNVRILGAEHIPPEPYLISKLMEDYFLFYQSSHRRLHPVLLAAEMHERLVTIHPFIDGNGRTSRLVMNLILQMHGYPLAILKGDHTSRLSYFRALEAVQVDGNPESFYSLIIDAVTRTLEERIDLLRTTEEA